MTDPNLLIINAIIIGLVGGVIPGPILASAFLSSIVDGFKGSVRIILWGMLNETLVALFSLTILRMLNLPISIFHILSIVGGILLIDISIKLWKIKNLEINTKEILSLKKISYLILTNGVLWAYWITVCIPQALQLDKYISLGSYLFLILVEISWLISTILATYIFSLSKALLNDTKQIKIVKIFALVYIYFAVSFFYSSLIYFKNLL